MSTQKIPNQNKQWVQSNRGDYQGNIWSTFSMDFDSSLGVAKPSKPLTQVLGANEFGSAISQALVVHDGYYYAVTNSSVYRCLVSSDPTDSSNWSSVATLGAEDLGLETDATSFSGKLLMSLGTDIMTWDGSTKDDDWWTVTVSGTALTANKTHTLEVLRTGVDTLFVTDGNVVRYYNATAGHTSVTLDTLMTAHVLLPALDKMWVGTYSEIENNAFMYEIQVGNSIASQAYPIDGMACLAGFIYRNTPYIVTERGYIQVFNGAGFETVAQFPFADESKVMIGVRPGLVQDSATSRAIHPKGIKIKGHYAYIFVNADDEFNGGQIIDTRTYSGVWVLNLQTYSLSHRYAPDVEGTTTRGWSKVTRSGPLLLTNTPETRIMVGTEVNTTEEGVWMEGSGTPYGWFTTVRHEVSSIADAFEKFVIKADTLDSTDTIDVKYKAETRPDFPLQIDDIVWLNATQFTTSNALTDVETTDADEQGDELFITGGYKAGYSATIEKIEGTTTKTVTVDTSLGTLNETSDIQINAWKKLSDQYTSADGEYKDIGGVDGNQAAVEYKVELVGDVTVREIISKSNSKDEL